MHHPYPGHPTWPSPNEASDGRHGERIARLEVVADHLASTQRDVSARMNHQGEAMSRVFARLDRTERQIPEIRADLAALKDLPTRVQRQEDHARRRRAEKASARELRREALAMAQYLLAIVLVLATAMGWVAPDVFKVVLPALAPGK